MTHRKRDDAAGLLLSVPSWSRQCCMVAWASTEQPVHRINCPQQPCSTANSELIKLFLSRATKTWHILPTHHSAREYLRTVLKTETMLTNCAHQRCFQWWLIVYFPSVIPRTSLDIFFFGWAERSSLAITSCLVNKLSSKTASCQELWSRGVLTTPCSLDKRSPAL